MFCMDSDTGREQDEVSSRAEYIIAEVYGTVRKIREDGRRVYAIVLPISHYRIIQDYRARLGEVKEGLPDYLGRYELFGIPIYTDGGDAIVIKTRPPDGDARG